MGRRRCAGHGATEVCVEITDDHGFTVTDDGPGMPVTVDGRAWLPRALTELPVGGDIRGLGLGVVRAVSVDVVIDTVTTKTTSVSVGR
ncbi:hypothetical protein [Actinokineospora sp. HUAS TT18]|uniref:hypothetical protein n=1 Tax=Actinokineospora sp. HUAS TT18 TaxID=3447451 RepID=UPI003F52478C